MSKCKKYSQKEEIGYIETLPEKRIAAGAAIFNELGQLLIIKNSYRDFWTIPGGVVEKFEAPWDGAVREVKEEIGLDIEIDSLFTIDSTSSYKGEDKEYKDEVLVMVFKAKIVDSKVLVKIDNDEVEDYKFADIKELNKYFNDGWMNRLGKLIGSAGPHLIKTEY
jgi:8-oxo-dGTP pyrophosphatase MutT (NUDIX family)